MTSTKEYITYKRKFPAIHLAPESPDDDKLVTHSKKIDCTQKTESQITRLDSDLNRKNATSPLKIYFRNKQCQINFGSDVGNGSRNSSESSITSRSPQSDVIKDEATVSGSKQSLITFARRSKRKKCSSETCLDMVKENTNCNPVSTPVRSNVISEQCDDEAKMLSSDHVEAQIPCSSTGFNHDSKALKHDTSHGGMDCAANTLEKRVLHEFINRNDGTSFRVPVCSSEIKCRPLFSPEKLNNRTSLSRPEMENNFEKKIPCFSPLDLGLSLPRASERSNFSSKNVNSPVYWKANELNNSVANQRAFFINQLMNENMMNRANNLQTRVQDSLTMMWSEQELDSLWIGVRRHGRGNWNSMLKDPRLYFSAWRCGRDLAEKWVEEEGKLLHGGNSFLPLNYDPRRSRPPFPDHLRSKNQVFAANEVHFPTGFPDFSHLKRMVFNNCHVGAGDHSKVSEFRQPCSGDDGFVRKLGCPVDKPGDMIVIDSDASSEETISDDQTGRPLII